MDLHYFLMSLFLEIWKPRLPGLLKILMTKDATAQPGRDTENYYEDEKRRKTQLTTTKSHTEHADTTAHYSRLTYCGFSAFPVGWSTLKTTRLHSKVDRKHSSNCDSPYRTCSWLDKYWEK